MQPEPGSFYSFQEKSEHSDERGVKVREEGAILTREEQEGQSLVPQPNTKLEGGVAPITRPLGHAHQRERGTWDSGAVGCGKGSTLMGLQLAPQQTARPGAGPLPPFSWFLSGSERSLQHRGAGAQRTQYAGLPCTCLQFKARGMGWGCWCIEARKTLRQET